MATMGCHSCKVDLQQYKDVPYQQTPCAKCALSRDSQKTFKRISLFDSDINVDQLQDTVAAQTQEQALQIPPWISQRLLQQIRKACQANMMVTLSSIILKILKLAKTAPRTVQILIMKMQHPDMSYYQIARAVSYPCSKQNVLHHLKHAVQLFPELSKALLIDTRFSPGRGSAVHSIARMRANNDAINKLKNGLYAQHAFNKPATIQQINEIFAMPYTSSVAGHSSGQE